jgi:hypothetical protein
MNLTEIAPKIKGSNLLFELPEIVTRQQLFIGQEVFYKAKYYKEKVKISGYLFVVENNQLQLRYLTQTTESIQQVLEGSSELPDEIIISIDELICL